MELIKEPRAENSFAKKYPKDWNFLNLGKSAILKARIGWQGLTTAEYLDTGDYYLITGTDFKGGYIDWDNCVYVEKLRFDQDKNIQVKIGDVLVTKDGTIGKVAYVDRLPKDTTLNSGVFVIRPINDSYHPRYLYYVLMSEQFRQFLGKLTAGSTISHLYQKDFVHYDFPVPPTIAEQKSIVTALSDVDDLISNLDKLISKKKAIKQGAMQQLLTPPHKGGKRLAGFSGEWVEKKLGDVAQMNSGGTPSSKVSEYYNGNINWVSITDMTNSGKFIYSTEKKITEKGLQNSSARLFSVDTVLLAMYASIGKCTIAKTELATSQAILGITVNTSLGIEFLYYYLQFKKDELISQGQQGTQSNLNKGMVQDITMCLPQLKEQIAIAQILSDMDYEIEQLETKKAKYLDVKQGMMQELLTGKTRLI